MANPPRAMDFREKILREGVLKHRQTSIALPRWKPRYVVFKMSQSGRLQLTVYKEQPTVPSNEIKEIPIEEYGGLEVNLRLDSEKYTFAIITNSMTDCFAVETHDELNKWTALLQEYLGKELVLPITIPHKQLSLRSGKGQLRIRNTGFTITTCDNPPRSQGTWQIMHIRKFGGTKTFRFETGSKCPSGEFAYSIITEDNSRVKSLFSDLSQHKPIFTDDRLGRRMTIGRRTSKKENTGRGVGGEEEGDHPMAASRYSLQTTKSEPSSPFLLYENHQVPTSNFPSKSPCQIGSGLMRGRRNSAGQIFNPLSHTASIPELSRAHKEDSARVCRSIEDLSNGLYQNVHRSSRQERQSSYRRVPNPNAIPKGYYKVSPPPVLKKYSVSSPPSSPDESSLESPKEVSSPLSEENEAENEEEYVKLTPTPLAFRIEGEQLVVNRVPPGSPKHLMKQWSPPAGERETVYQNLEFKRNSTQNAEDNHRITKISTPTADRTPPSFKRESSSDVERSPHSYANVTFAFEVARGRSPRSGSPRSVSPRSVSPRKRNPDSSLLIQQQRRSISPLRTQSEQYKHNPATHRRPMRKISTPIFRSEQQAWERDQSGAVSSHSTNHTAHSVVSVDVSLVNPTAPSLQSPLRNSHSNIELYSSCKEAMEDTEIPRLPLPDYYNIFVPNLPAHSPQQSAMSTGLVSHLTEAPSTHRSTVQPHSECPKLAIGENESTDAGYPKVTCPTKLSVVDISNDTGYAKFKREDRRQMVDSPPPQSGYSTLHDMQQMVQKLNDKEKHLVNKVNGKVTIRSSPISNYDHLEIHTPSRSPCYSPVPAPDSRGSSPRPNCYDTLAPIQNGTSTQTFVVEEQHYDSLIPRTHFQRSKSSSPELTKSSSVPVNRNIRYERKVALLGHSHSYEDVDIEKVKQRGIDRSTAESPTNMQHPLEWLRGSQTSSKILQNDPRHGETLPDIARVSRNSPNTQSRRKQLPLQEADKDTIMDGIDSTDGVPPALPTKTSRTRNGFPVGTTKPPQQHSHEVDLASQQSGTSETSDLLSSTEGSRHSTVSNESTLSAEMERSQPLGSKTRSRTPSPFRRDTHELVELRPRIESVKVETIAANNSMPKLPPRMSVATSSSDSDSSEFSPTCIKSEETSQSPSIPPRSHFSSPSHNHDAEKAPPVPPKQTSSIERAPPLPQRSPEQTSLTFTLPQKEIIFEKPPVPPRPRLLNQSDADGEIRTAKYVTVDIKPQRNTLTTYSSVPRPRIGKIMRNATSLDSDRGAYTSIDFETTHQLHKMMEERKEMKRS